jgi:hypothetical protein
MNRKDLITIGLIALAALGGIGIVLRMNGWLPAHYLIAVGFLGFPLLYGYISWPVGKRLPDREWVGTISVMVLFALIILLR